VLSFLISAVITPPDIMSQFLLAVPLCLLYVLSIGIAWLLSKKKSAETPSS
jgi:sec-independent protein translocase protein TatC